MGRAGVLAGVGAALLPGVVGGLRPPSLVRAAGLRRGAPPGTLPSVGALIGGLLAVDDLVLLGCWCCWMALGPRGGPVGARKLPWALLGPRPVVDGDRLADVVFDLLLDDAVDEVGGGHTLSVCTLGGGDGGGGGGRLVG